MKFIAGIILLMMVVLLVRGFMYRRYFTRFPPNDSGRPYEDPTPGWWPARWFGPFGTSNTHHDSHDGGDGGPGDA
jgi:hypothetical protein